MHKSSVNHADMELYLGRWVCSCWPCAGSSVVLGNHGCELLAVQGEQTDGS